MAEQFGFGGDDGTEDETSGVTRDSFDIEEPGDSFKAWMAFESIEWMAAGGDWRLKKRLQNFKILDVWIMYYTNIKRHVI